LSVSARASQTPAGASLTYTITRKRLYSRGPEALHFPAPAMEAGLLRRPAPEGEARLKLAAFTGRPFRMSAHIPQYRRGLTAWLGDALTTPTAQ